MESTTTLNKDTIEGLQDLIEINLDSAKGFDAAADKIEDEKVASFFRDCGQERSGFAKDLSKFVAANRTEPKSSGTAKGAVHRWWLELRGTVQRGDEHAVLAEAERGEDAIKDKYEDVLKNTAGSAVNDVLLGQYSTVKSRHDQIRAMRDATA
ncbi:MAG: PA2169 family four-helix-bundle protein [Phycisphaerales bacterium]